MEKKKEKKRKDKQKKGIKMKRKTQERIWSTQLEKGALRFARPI